MGIEIKQRKIVPDQLEYGHRGEHASLAMDEAGCRAWGFGIAKADADKAAFRAVCDLRIKRVNDLEKVVDR